MQRYSVWQDDLGYIKRELMEDGEYVLHSEAQARISELEFHLRKMTVGTQGEHRIPTMREVEEARAALENSNEPG